MMSEFASTCSGLTVITDVARARDASSAARIAAATTTLRPTRGFRNTGTKSELGLPYDVLSDWGIGVVFGFGIDNWHSSEPGRSHPGTSSPHAAIALVMPRSDNGRRDRTRKVFFP